MFEHIEKVWRIVPDDGLNVVLHPPGHGIKPIRQEYFCLEYGYNQFSKRPKKQGVFDGFIGSDLRMHVLVPLGDSVLRNWEESEGRP